MRILHTSDWHLGRSFHREGMLGHQAAYVDHLLAVVASERVDLVVVAGDVYDRALPPVDAVRLANETFTRLSRSRAKVVVTSGNHDSAQRLGFGSELIDAAGVFIRTRADSVGTPVLVGDDHGEVAVYGIPYLDPDAVRSGWRLRARSHEAALTEAMRRVRGDLAGRDARSVVLAHAFVAGGQPSDSERDISVGGISRVPTSVFEGFDYTALGHLHGQHTLTPVRPLQRVTTGLLVLRGRPGQGLLAGRPRAVRRHLRRVRRSASAPATRAHPGDPRRVARGHPVRFRGARPGCRRP